MKVMNRNKKKIKYKLYLGKEDVVDDDGNKTGEIKRLYGTLKEAKMVVSINKNMNAVEEFGVLNDYDRLMTTDDLKCKLDEDSIVYIEDRIGKNTYIVKRRADSENFISFALRKVNVDDSD